MGNSFPPHPLLNSTIVDPVENASLTNLLDHDMDDAQVDPARSLLLQVSLRHSIPFPLPPHSPSPSWSRTYVYHGRCWELGVGAWLCVEKETVCVLMRSWWREWVDMGVGCVCGGDLFYMPLWECAVLGHAPPP